MQGLVLVVLLYISLRSPLTGMRIADPRMNTTTTTKILEICAWTFVTVHVLVESAVAQSVTRPAGFKFITALSIVS